MPSKVVPQILESFFWLRSFAESRKHAMVRIGFFDFSPGLELGCLLGAPARGISSHNWQRRPRDHARPRVSWNRHRRTAERRVQRGLRPQPTSKLAQSCL